MNPEQIKILGNKKFLYKNLKDIFSEHISTKYTSLDLDHNKILIEKLINEKDSDKKIKFEKLFSLTFVDCLNHIIKNHIIQNKLENNSIELLEGLEDLNTILDKSICSIT